MLVLSRKKLTSICIDGGITITVVKIKGDKVQLGIEAPKETLVARGEIYPQLCAKRKKPPLQTQNTGQE